MGPHRETYGSVLNPKTPVHRNLKTNWLVVIQCRGKAAPYPLVGGPDHSWGPHNIYCISKLEPSLYP